MLYDALSVPCCIGDTCVEINDDKCPNADKGYCELGNDLCDKNGNDNGLRKRCY